MNINSTIVPGQVAFSNKTSIWQKIMPYLLVLSFAFVNLSNVFFLANGMGSQTAVFGMQMGSVQTILDVIVYAFIYGIISWAFFEFVLMMFHFLSAFNLYIKFIPKTVINTRFRFWFIIKNIILGIVSLLFMLVPYMFAYLAVISLILDFAVVFCMYFDLRYKYFDDAIAPFIFNGIMIPLIFYEILTMVWM